MWIILRSTYLQIALKYMSLPRLLSLWGEYWLIKTSRYKSILYWALSFSFILFHSLFRRCFLQDLLLVLFKTYLLASWKMDPFVLFALILSITQSLLMCLYNTLDEDMWEDLLTIEWGVEWCGGGCEWLWVVWWWWVVCPTWPDWEGCDSIFEMVKQRMCFRSF